MPISFCLNSTHITRKLVTLPRSSCPLIRLYHTLKCSHELLHAILHSKKLDIFVTFFFRGLVAVLSGVTE